MFNLIFLSYFIFVQYILYAIIAYRDAISEINGTATVIFLIFWFFFFFFSFSGNLDKQTALGNTVLHYCSIYNKPECLKLLLRGKPTLDLGKFII